MKTITQIINCCTFSIVFGGEVGESCENLTSKVHSHQLQTIIVLTAKKLLTTKLLTDQKSCFTSDLLLISRLVNV